MIPKRKYLAPKRSNDDINMHINDINEIKKLIEKNPIWFPEPDRTKFLNIIEVYRLIREGLPPLEKKVKHLATKKKEIINYEKTFDNFENAIARDPRMKRILELANEIIREDKKKNKALKILDEIRIIELNILSEVRHYIMKFEDNINPNEKAAEQIDIKTFKKYKYMCEKCGRLFRARRESCPLCGERLRPTKRDLKTMKSKQKEILQIRDKFRKMLDTSREILEAIMKIDDEYKKLLDRKNAGESVDHLIAENRREKERLEKEDKEKSEIMSKWGKSEEGRKIFNAMAMAKTMARMNPIMQIRGKLRFTLNLNLRLIKEKEQEYEELVERKNKGEYVDDLIKQNRHMVQSLEKDKKKIKVALADLESKEKSE
jgi:hypothetical protein